MEIDQDTTQAHGGEPFARFGDRGYSFGDDEGGAFDGRFGDRGNSFRDDEGEADTRHEEMTRDLLNFAWTQSSSSSDSAKNLVSLVSDREERFIGESSSIQA